MIPTFHPRNSCIAICLFVSARTFRPWTHVWRQLHLSAVARCSDSYCIFFLLLFSVYTDTYFVPGTQAGINFHGGSTLLSFRKKILVWSAAVVISSFQKNIYYHTLTSDHHYWSWFQSGNKRKICKSRNFDLSWSCLLSVLLLWSTSRVYCCCGCCIRTFSRMFRLGPVDICDWGFYTYFVALFCSAAAQLRAAVYFLSDASSRYSSVNFIIIRAKRVSNWYIPKKKSARVHVCTCARVK